MTGQGEGGAVLGEDARRIAADALRTANRYPARKDGGDAGWQQTVEEITVRDADAVIAALAPVVADLIADGDRARVELNEIRRLLRTGKPVPAEFLYPDSDYTS